MRYFLFLVLLISEQSFCQNYEFKSTSPRIKALIIGISNYENLNDLGFAHQDALYFDSLVVNNFPNASHILLTDSLASYEAIINALYSLLSETNKGDTVFFYFSGHGDCETLLEAEPGFLLTHDTPSNNYLISGLRINELKSILETLVLKKEAEVFLFIDACRAGVAIEGNKNGPGNTASSLMELFKNQILFLSCKPDQYSIESSSKGGGLFTHYLIKGLEGDADNQGGRDGNLVVEELRRFLYDSVMADSKYQQTPIAIGDPTKLLWCFSANVSSKSVKSHDRVSLFSRPLKLQVTPQNSKIEESTKIDTLSPKEKVNKFNALIKDNKLIEPKGDNAFHHFRSIDTNSFKASDREALKAKLLNALNRIPRDVLIEYINSEKSNIDYPSAKKCKDQLAFGLTILSEEDIQYQKFKSQFLFFSSLTKQLSSSELSDSIINDLEEAISIEPYAAYLHNELGNIYSKLKNWEYAILAYERAIQISPKWELPTINLRKVENHLEKSPSGINTFAGNNRQGKDRALFFAVNTYDIMPDLRNPVQNAKDIAKELEESYGFLTEVILNPTLEQIEQKITYYKKQYQRGLFDKEGQLLIFFTGHGDRRGNNGYFMPKDANPERPHVTAIEYDYWRNEINRIDCQHILVAIDACHSLTFDPNWNSKIGLNFQRPGEKFVDKVLLNHQNYIARLFFTSDAIGDKTPDRSNFSRKFLEGLRTYSSKVAYLTSSELFGSYISRASPTPRSGDFGNDEVGSAFLFFRKQISSSSRLYLDQESAWLAAKKINTVAAYQSYLSQYPNGDFRLIAQLKINQIGYTLSKIINSELVEPNNLVFIKGGTFQMGSKNERDNEKPIHSVTLSDFYISPYEVTFEEYDTFCAATGKKKPDDEGWGRGKHPVINVSWYDAIEYCNWLSKKRELTPVYSINKSRKDPKNKYDDLKWTVTINWRANGYRLPTEAEWEYAARSKGKNEKWAGTSNESDLANYGNGSGDEDGFKSTAPIGSFRSNELGLYDMSGNVWEWCWDWYDAEYYSKSTNTNPKGTDTDSGRVIRGGSWHNGPALLRCAYRSDGTPDDRVSGVGFRLSRAR